VQSRSRLASDQSAEPLGRVEVAKRVELIGALLAEHGTVAEACREVADDLSAAVAPARGAPGDDDAAPLT
jgi:hypothetical protein